MKDEHFNGLRPDEQERLALLMEECAEVIGIAGKILRHGYQSVNPIKPGPNNRQLLTEELGHVLHAIDRMVEVDVLQVHLQDARVLKAERIGRWLHHQKESLPHA